jgi:hypothetical protein
MPKDLTDPTATPLPDMVPTDPPEPPARSEPDADLTPAPPAADAETDQSPAKLLSDPGKSRRLANLKPGDNEHARAAREAKRARPARPETLTRQDVLDILKQIAADDDESGAYRVAAARLLLTPEAQAGNWSCPLPCCQGRPFKSVTAWIEAMGAADKIAPREISKSVDEWLEGLDSKAEN